MTKVSASSKALPPCATVTAVTNPTFVTVYTKPDPPPPPTVESSTDNVSFMA